MERSFRIWRRRIIDFCLYSIVFVCLVLSHRGYITPTNAYVKCNDPSISHDLQKDTISVALLITICLLCPFIMITIVEWLLPVQRQPDTSVLKHGLQRGWDCLCTLLVGGLFSYFIVEILKTSVSETRPHFMSSCKPNLTRYCSQAWIPVTWENCTNPYSLSQGKLQDTMKSFPSGHACIGIFTSVYMSLYTYKRIQVSWSQFLPVVCQLCWWLWGLLCCASRVWDRKHFWWDVAAGGVIGGVFAYLTVIHLCKWFQDKKSSHESSVLSEQVSEISTTTNIDQRSGHSLKAFIIDESH